MPLILPTLQGELINIYEKGSAGNTFPAGVGHRTAKAYLNYCSTIMNMGSGSFSGMPGSTILGGDLGEIYYSTSPSGALTAQKIAKAFNDCLSTLITTFQTTIVTAPGFGGLVPELIDLLSTPKPSATLFATKFATALNNFTSAAIISGVVPGTPPVPFTGPPS